MQLSTCLLSAFTLSTAPAMGITIEPAFAQQAPSCEGSPDACQQISDISKQYNRTFNSHDVPSMVALFTTDAVMVGEGGGKGVRLSGREAIEKFYSEIFKSRASDHA